MTLNRTLLLQDIFDFIKLFGYHWQPTWQPTWLDKNEIAKAYFSKFYVFISDNDENCEKDCEKKDCEKKDCE